MRKFLFRSTIAIVALCLALFGFAACSSSDDDATEGKMPSVKASSITVREFATGITVSWDAVKSSSGAPANYEITCNSSKQTIKVNYVAMSNWQGFTLPSDGVFKFTIVAQALGYVDSDPVNYTYTAQGVKLDSPQIKSFNGGVLEWNGVTSASAYRVSVDGEPVTGGSGDGLYHGTSLDISDYPAAKALKISVSAVGVNDRYYKESDVMTVGVNAAHTKLTLLPVEDYTLNGSVITWSPVGGASTYRVVDIEGNVAKTVKANDTLRYDMTGNRLIMGVFPTSSDKTIADADIAPVDIKYLDGEGTQQSPYLIKTPFDLRAIDYYEFMYAYKNKETLALGTAPAGNRYRIENDVNFNSVAALDSESNFLTLTQPFYGYLDGNLKKLSNIRVVYDGGYWAMFDYITTYGSVRNMTLENAEIENVPQDTDFPIGTMIAAIARRNYGTIRGITLSDARFAAAGGPVSGICSYNYGTVTKCTVSGEFIQNSIKSLLGDDAVLLFNQTSYEMAGVVLENYGTVSDNVVTRLDIRGSACDNVTDWQYDDYGNRKKPLKYGNPYNNVRSAAGVVSINRAGGVVTGNSFNTVNLIMVSADYASGTEFGGLVAYNAKGATINYSSGLLGTLTYSSTNAAGKQVSSQKGKSGDYRGTVVGKNDGTATGN